LTGLTKDPGSEYACFALFSENHVDQILDVHKRVHITLQDRAWEGASCKSLVRPRRVADWTYDTANIIRAALCGGLFVRLYLSHPEISMFVSYHIIIVPSFHGEGRSDPRGAFLHFRRVRSTRILDGRGGPGGETLHVRLLRQPCVRIGCGGVNVQEQYKGGGGGEMMRISGRGSG
jgi:hypothetical protein